MRLLDFVRDRAEVRPGPSSSLPIKTVRQQVNEFPELRRPVLADLLSHQRRRAVTLAKRKSELVTMQHRLLNAYLAGTVDG